MAEPAPPIPEGFVQGEDGCICPAPKEKKECEDELKPACGRDPRYTNTNITKRCYFSFIDYQRCVRLLGDYPGCEYFLKCYKALCPRSWQEKWFDQMERGVFARPIYPPSPIIYPQEKKDTCPSDLDDDEPPDEDPC